MAEHARNVLREPLEPCGLDPLTGFYRDGCCRTGRDDLGLHVVCAEVTAEFLAFSLERGNDLITPKPEFGFPGLKAGDRWCLCVQRWKEAAEAGPKIAGLPEKAGRTGVSTSSAAPAPCVCASSSAYAPAPIPCSTVPTPPGAASASVVVAASQSPA